MSTNLVRFSPADEAIQAIEGARRNEQYVRSVDCETFTTKFARIPLRDIDQRAFEHFQHSLLNSFATNIAELMDTGDRTDFIDLIEKDNSCNQKFVL